MATAEAGNSLPRPFELGATADLPRAIDPLLSLEAFASPPAHTSRGPLHSGSTWVGVQRSGRNSYEVTVKFDEVDIDASKVCGTLEIKGLTPELDSLVTFFEGEIVGEVGSPGFRTGRFGATEFDDLKHWRRFPAFTRNRLERGLIKPDLNLRASKNKPYVFLRLKEKHVVNHRVEAIHGASYAGFYYCCLDCEPSIVPLDSQTAPLHRGVSPPSRTLMPARARRTSSASARGRPEPSLLAQTRPVAPRAPSATRLSPPPVVVNLPVITNAQSTLPLVAPAPSRPAQPRRTSSGSISYAAAVRGEAVSTSPALPELSSSPTASTSSGSPVTPPSIPPVIQVSEPSRPASTDLPTPKVELPEPAFSIFAPLDSTVPSLPPIWQAVAAGPFSPSYNAAHFGQPAGPSTSPTDEEWPVPVQATSQVTPPPRPPAALRRMSSDVATVLAKAQGAFVERGRPGRLGGHKSTFPYSAADENLYGDGDEGQTGFDDRGLRSWTEATISGFYFHHSASPYQELSLRYVPSYRGGTAEYSFR